MVDNFSFDSTKRFDENFMTFLVAAEAIDENLAIILRNNAAALAQIVRDGERDTNARALFNMAIAAALDDLIATRDSSEVE